MCLNEKMMNLKSLIFKDSILMKPLFNLIMWPYSENIFNDIQGIKQQMN